MHVGGDLVFFDDTATTELYTLSLHDALPISSPPAGPASRPRSRCRPRSPRRRPARAPRSEEHTSELQSRQYLVCRLLLEKKKNELQRHLKTSIICQLNFDRYCNIA